MEPRMRKAFFMLGGEWSRACLLLAASMVLAAAAGVRAQSRKDQGPQPSLTLAEAAMCEDVRDYAPFNVSAVFSVEIGKVSCYTLFDPVPERTFIYHTWYYRDRQSTRKRLTLKPPRWATVSTIQLREADKGPWRVEISDEEGRVLSVQRFSVTE